ncbi:MAG: two-component system NtrC family sensor kinase [Nitrospinales bacterium]|jgi:two-component system NtrC family sensor kinase
MENKSLNILLIEDDEDDAFYIKDILNEGLGSPPPHIEHFSSIEKNLKQINPFDYDLALFDYRLGKTNGIELVRNFRYQNCNIPIILLTGQGDQEVAVEAMKAGTSDYLTKGKLSIESVTKSIHYVLGLHKEAELRKQAEDKLYKSHTQLAKAYEELQTSIRKLETAQKQIIISEKLAGIGRLVAGVCHEILNPLNIISGHTQSLLMERKTDGPLTLDLNSVMEEISRITKIITGLLKFSRKGSMELKKSNIVKELESVLILIEKDMRLEGIEIIRDFESTSAMVMVDTDGMRQVFLNLLNNAKHAISKGGTLTISTETNNNDANLQPVPTEETPFKKHKKILRIKFVDTGAGIAKDDLEKVFEPFFTTKPEEKGTGLGLSISYSIIERHGGILEIDSKVDVGTTVVINLPIQA